MTPLTRKENYLNEIVGWGNTAPEKPLTPEEFFFAAILGEAVQVPDLSNASRYELFLAKIAGYNVNISPPTYTSPRLEFFLAKAAGMDVETPVPVTREEIFWDNYSAVQKIEGIPPIVFTSNGKSLKNYRIYGNTVKGESVGDRTRNLFDGQLIAGYYTDNTLSSMTGAFGIYQSCKISLPAGTYTIVFSEAVRIIRYIEFEGTYLANPEGNRDAEFYTFTLNGNNTVSLAFRNASNTTWDGTIKIQIVEGSKSLPYEPYGYRVPITINSNTTNIYLDEQLVKSGDDADYIDYDTQKRYNADGTTVDVELPTLQTVEETNTLSVGTTVQPSKVMVKIGEASAYKVRYYVDDTMARVETVSDGKNAQGFTPTKASTARYNYTFMGWSTTKGSATAEAGVLNDITADKSLYAVFSQSLRTFTVYFYNGSTLLQTAENVQYGGTATYTGETPTKDGFTFSRWQPSNVNITADTSCYAQFTEG